MAVQDIILHTSGPLGEDEMRQLEGLGLRVVSRLAGGALRVRGESAATTADLVGLGFVDSAAPFDPVDKLDPVLSAATELTRAAADVGTGDTTLRVLVTLDATADTAATTARLGELGEVIEAAPSAGAGQRPDLPGRGARGTRRSAARGDRARPAHPEQRRARSCEGRAGRDLAGPRRVRRDRRRR